jgi:quercetin dioxygenase-like cupin family protein
LVENAVDLEEVAAGRGVVWTLRTSEDLNANLVRFEDGGGVGEHVNEEVDVILVGVTGSGSVVVDGYEHALGAGKLVLVPKGSRRSTRSVSEGFAYLTVHKRRGPLQIGSGR